MKKNAGTSEADLPLTLLKATVIHCNKYSEAVPAIFLIPQFRNRMHTEIVFRIRSTGDDWRVRVSDLELPMYAQQSVTLVVKGSKALAYIDDQTNYYYYFSRNLSTLLGTGIPGYWFILAGLAGAALVYLLGEQEITGNVILPLIGSWLIYFIQKWVLHYRAKKEFDRILSGNS